jgi:hypothetical protein
MIETSSRQSSEEFEARFDWMFWALGTHPNDKAGYRRSLFGLEISHQRLPGIQAYVRTDSRVVLRNINRRCRPLQSTLPGLALLWSAWHQINNLVT